MSPSSSGDSPGKQRMAFRGYYYGPYILANVLYLDSAVVLLFPGCYIYFGTWYFNSIKVLA